MWTWGAVPAGAMIGSIAWTSPVIGHRMMNSPLPPVLAPTADGLQPPLSDAAATTASAAPRAQRTMCFLMAGIAARTRARSQRQRWCRADAGADAEYNGGPHGAPRSGAGGGGRRPGPDRWVVRDPPALPSASRETHAGGARRPLGGERPSH